MTVKSKKAPIYKPIKLKKCHVCGNEFKPFSSTTKACSLDCAVKIARLKTAKDSEKQFKQDKKAFYDNDLIAQKEKAQTAFNKYIRLRDKDLPCVSCGKDANAQIQWHAGHFHSVGARPDLRFNEDNVHKQCSRCNNFLSANLELYSKELLKRIGKKRLNALALVTSKKYTAQDFKAICVQYKKKIKDLINADK